MLQCYIRLRPDHHLLHPLRLLPQRREPATCGVQKSKSDVRQLHHCCLVGNSQVCKRSRKYQMQIN